jgi:hypothetical protein
MQSNLRRICIFITKHALSHSKQKECRHEWSESGKEQTGLIYLHGCIELYYGVVFLSQPYCSLGKQNDSVIFS